MQKIITGFGLSIEGEIEDGKITRMDTTLACKAISLWQYWSSLCIWGEKEYETRSWGTSYQGPLVIHAAKTQKEVEAVRNRNSKMTPSQWEGDVLNKVLKSHGIMSVDQFPYGAALGVVDLVGCYHTETIRDRITSQERAFGNWQPGRFAWKLANPRPFKTPIPMRGMQGLFNCEVKMT